MFCPPLFLTAWGLWEVVSCHFRNRPDPLPLLVDIVTLIALPAYAAFFTAKETFLEDEDFIERSTGFYLIGIGAGVLCFRRLTFGLALSCAAALLLNIRFKRLYGENQMLRAVKGYPHFDISRMSERDFREEDPGLKETEELSPDERIRRDREKL